MLVCEKINLLIFEIFRNAKRALWPNKPVLLLLIITCYAHRRTRPCHVRSYNTTAYTRARARALLLASSLAAQFYNGGAPAVAMIMMRISVALQLVQLLGAASASQCAVELGRCNVVDGKLPPVRPSLDRSLSVETGLPAAEKEAFEHQLGHALRTTEAVLHATLKFGETLYRSLIIPAGPSQREQALVNAFVPTGHHAFNTGNTGYVGNDTGRIEPALRHGNIREVWALAYALTKTGFFDSSVDKLLDQPNGAEADRKLTSRGFHLASLKQRSMLIRQCRTAAAADSMLDSSQRVLDYAFPPFDSWVRFDFSASRLGGGGNGKRLVSLWNASREWVGGHTTLMSNDLSIQPPLSAAELAYQCGGGGGGGGGTHAPPPPPCRLGWAPGKLSWRLPTPRPFRTMGGSGLISIPGYLERAEALGYRAVAGPSGTTQNMLQYADFFNATRGGGWPPLLRLAMLAWMLPTDDHSFWEILLGAEPYMPDGFGISNTTRAIEHLSRLCPPGQSLKLPDPEQDVVFSCAVMWQTVGQSVVAPPSWNAAQRAEWARLTGQGSGSNGGTGGGDSGGTAGGTNPRWLLAVLCSAVLGGVVTAAALVTVRRRRGSNTEGTMALLPSASSGGDTTLGVVPTSGSQPPPKPRTATADPYAVR